ncbi:MAG TPA: hypothetical protein VGR14_06435 [Verrucomicrobiae bacterium]|jgi:hypothetical protein|nr:hypothetical protein [Verrucomicrobiae bacterium]
MPIAKSDATEPGPLRTALCQIKASHPEPWWFFPEELSDHPAKESVHGFLGTGPIFIVGDQPSPGTFHYNHLHRRAFYDLLKEECAGDCHLTDFYKRRGLCSELKNGFDPVRHLDFTEHIEIFRSEVELLRPSTILAMGRIAEDLLKKYTEYNFEYILHFGVIGHAQGERETLLKRSEFEKSLRNAIRKARQAAKGKSNPLDR